MTLMSSVCIKFSYATLAPPMLGPYLDGKYIVNSSSTTNIEKVCVITTDGCVFVGILEGYDRSTNIILHKTEERIIRPEGTTIRDLGTFILRGVTVATIGLIDPEIDGQIEWDTVRAPKLDTTKHPN